MKEYYLWEILKMANEKQIKNGDRFKMIDTPISLIIEYDELSGNIIYSDIMGDTIKRETVTLCSGEIKSKFIQIENLYIKEIAEFNKAMQALQDITVLSERTYKEFIKAVEDKRKELGM